MAARTYKLDPESQRTIAAYIRAGAYPHFAAEAVGIPAFVFDEWLAIGNPENRSRGWKPHRLYTPLWHAVMEATAQARVAAEVKAFGEDPLSWLKQGPGKERPGVPGWSQTVRPQPAQAPEPNFLMDPAVQDLLQRMLQALAPFPEARVAVARALAGSRTPGRTGLPDRREE